MNFGSPLMPENPPHVWGIRRHILLKSLLPGITPTCVGKAVFWVFLLLLFEDHPHMCGESFISSGLLLTPLGSPPHVWGKPGQVVVVHVKERITPTCVGKALIILLSIYRAKDHPHMCGESMHRAAAEMLPTGSPPHVWGKLLWRFFL